jgi:protoheme IX farnesyltransferase
MSPWLSLIKFKLILAVTMTGISGYIISKGDIGINLFTLTGGIFFLAGGAGALNQHQERESDSLMKRTRQRPLPSGLIKARSGLILAACMLIIGSLLLAITGLLPFILGILNVILYNLLYTKLKKVSYLAIIPGAMVGALPPVIGWTAAGGYIFSPTILFLATLIFMWQIPHFWLLVIKYNKEYEEAGFKTPIKIFNENQVKRIVFAWITISSLFATTYFYFGIEINIIFTCIILTAIILFILGFYWLLFRLKGKLSTAFVLSNIFITSIFIILATGSLI